MLINTLKNEYKRIEREQGLGEENIKIDLVRDVFLKEMGYDIKKIKYEKNVTNGKTDMLVAVNNEILTVETKAGDHQIVYKDIEQLIRYLNTQGREWGLLTNGKDYLLLNAKIETTVSESNEAHFANIVLWFNIFASRQKGRNEHKLFGYLSRENIFEKQTTRFFRDIAQFKAYKFGQNEKSWNNYKSTLYSFFDFYVQHLGKTYRDKALEKILIDDFESFIEYKQVSSDETKKNNWSHINSLLLLFNDKGKISYNPFGSRRNVSLERNQNGRIKNQNNLTETNVYKIIKYYASKENASRNIAGFLLCSIMGFERSDVIDIEWGDIDLNRGIIHQGSRKLKCPKLLCDCFSIMYNEKIKNKNKLNNVFCTRKSNKYYKFSEVTLNDIFNRLENIDKSDNMWKMFSPKYVKNCSIEVYYRNGYSLDEVLYWTGCDFGQIADILSIENIYKRVEKNTKADSSRKRAVFEEILNTMLEEWK